MRENFFQRTAKEKLRCTTALLDATSWFVREFVSQKKKSFLQKGGSGFSSFFLPLLSSFLSLFLFFFFMAELQRVGEKHENKTKERHNTNTTSAYKQTGREGKKKVPHVILFVFSTGIHSRGTSSFRRKPPAATTSPLLASTPTRSETNKGKEKEKPNKEPSKSNSGR